jgi:acetylglutamate kinase
MDLTTKQIFDLLVENQETCKIGSDGDYSQEQCVFAVDFENIAKQIANDLKIKELQHHKDTTVGLYATDKEPEQLFEEIFVHLIEKIGMDGEKTFSAMDYEYYRDMFNKGIKMLMFRIS